MKNLYVVFLSVFILQFKSFAQQPADPIRAIEENLMRTRPHHLSPGDPNVISGSMIVNASNAGQPTGIPVSKFTPAELKTQCTFFGGDTLKDFDFESAKNAALNDGYKMLGEFKAVMYRKEFAFVKGKFNISDPVEADQKHTASLTSNKIGSAASTFASACNNVDFEDGNLNGWTAVSGYNTNSNAPLTIPNSALTVAVVSTNQPNNSCSDINIINGAFGNEAVGNFPGLDPNGGTTSVRVGGFNINTSNGYSFGCNSQKWWGGPVNYYANGEYIEKTITVNAANSLLSFDYAVILNDGGHPNGQQPYFHVFVTNTAGVVLSSCTQYYVQAAAGAPPVGFTYSGFVNSYDNSKLYYKNWTSNSINLTPYIGSSVIIRFVSAGCTAGAHMAWAYVDAICSSANIVASNNSPCSGSSVVLSAPPVAGGSYSWTGPGGFTATSQNVTVNASGTYNVLVTPSQGPACAYTLSTPLNFSPLPGASISAPPTLNCSTTSFNLNSSTTSGNSFSWTGPGGFTSTSQNPTVTQPGTYNLTVVNTANGCSSPASVVVNQNITPPGASISAPSTLNCSTTSFNLNSSTTSGNSFSWTGPGGFTSTSQNPTVTQPGTYNLTVVNTANGCSSPASVVVNQNTTPPGASISAPPTLNCSTTSFNLNSSTTSGNSFSWTGPGGFTSTSQNPTVTQPGTYNLTVVNTANGCSSAASVVVNQNTTPPGASIAAPGTLNCSTTSIILNSSTTSGNSFSWTGPGGFTSTSQNPSVTLGGTYNLTVVNTANGCSSTANVAVTQNATPPGAFIAAPGTLNCTTTSINLNGSTTSGNSYSWTGPGGFTSSSSSPAVTLGGTYNLTVLNTANGCSSTANVAVTQNTTAPGAFIGAPGTLNCTTTSFNLSGSTTSGTNYSWTGPGGFTSTSQNPTVSQPGTYNLTVVNTANGCSSTANVAVSQNTTAPGASVAPSGTLNCTTTLITLNGSSTSGNSYSWTGPGGFTSTSQNPSVSLGGTYNLTVVNTANGCSSTASGAVTQNTTAPAASINPPAAINCTNTSVTLNANPTSGVSYNWTGPSGFTSTNANPTTTVAGAYNLTVTSTFNNCKNTASANVVQNTTVSANATTNGTVTCDPAMGSINLFASPGSMNYTWTASGGGMVTSGINSPNATGYGAGTYSLFISNPTNGCTASATVAAITNTVQTPPVASSTGTVKCSPYTLNLSSPTSGVTYTWVPPAGSSVGAANSASTSANGGGTYTLYVTNTVNTCTNSSTVAVTTQTTKPVASIINNPTITCTNTMVTINGAPGAGVTYTWTGGTISGSNSNANVNVTSAGVYSLAVTSTSNGCSSLTKTVNITVNTASPSITMGSNQIIPCSPPTVQVTSTVSPGTATLNWTGANVCGGANSSSATACAPGVYTLTATNPGNGCFTQSTMTVNPSPGLNVNVTNTGTIMCSPTTVQVVASATPAANNTFSWSGPGIVSGNGTSSVTVNQPGTYSVVVTNTPSGCSFNFNNVVLADNSPVLPNAAVSNTVDCSSSSATISTTPSGSGPFNYSWSSGATSSVIVVSPPNTTSYVVTVTNTANGCTGTQTVSVTANTNPPTAVNISASSATLTCASPNATLTASSTGGTSYSWTPPAGGSVSNPTTTSTQITGGGVYTLVATGANGCSAAAATATITPDSNQPVFALSNASPSITCNSSPSLNSETITITNTVTASSYSWSPASGVSSATSNAVTFTQPGTYTCLIVATNGCTTNAVVSVANGMATPSVVAGTGTAQALSCTNSVVTIAPSFVPAANLTYTWSGPGISGSNSGPSIAVNQSGSYSLSITNTLTGCVSSTPIVIPVTGSNIVPTLTLSSSSAIGIGCLPNTSTISLNAQSNSSSLTYTWSTGANTSSISTSSPGVYTLSVTDFNSQCVASSTIAVQNNTISPNLTASSAGSLPCGGGTTSLSAISINTNVSYSWFGSGIVSGSNTASPSVNQAGSYTVIALDNVTGCSTTRTLSITQSTVSALAAADATTGPSPLTVNFSNQSLGAATYSWSFGDGNSSSQFNPSNTYLASGTYTVLLIATNGACSSSDTLIIKVMESLGIIPEVFTPNGDGHNDVFVIQGLDSYPNNNFQVFNRWGSPVYSAKPYKNDWDGTPNEQGKTGSGKLPTGTYFYLLELGDTNKSIYKGFIQIQY